MRRGLLALAVVAIVVPLVTARQVAIPRGQFMNYGAGVSSCGKWIAANQAQHLTYSAWVLGFVSGFGHAAVTDLRETDADAIDAWMNKFCREHPLETISHASQALVSELRSSK
jgi:hypothetical protein